MKVTVRDCLQLDSFANCIVVAGERKMENRVKAISVMDASDDAEAVKCGEAVVSLKGKTRSVFIVRELQKKLLRYAAEQKISS